MKILGILAFVMLSAATALVLRPVPIINEEDCQVVTGKVSNVFEGGDKDICLVLQNTSPRFLYRLFYINRGVERGLNPAELKKDLLGQAVTIKFPSYWTPLDPNDSVRHVAKLEFDGAVLFDETL